MNATRRVGLVAVGVQGWVSNCVEAARAGQGGVVRVLLELMGSEPLARQTRTALESRRSAEPGHIAKPRCGLAEIARRMKTASWGASA